MAQAKKLVEGYLLRAAHRSDIFAHILIWHLQGGSCKTETGKESMEKDTTVSLMSQAMAEQMEELRSKERRLGHVNKQLKIKVSFKLSLQESRRTGV
ncbi:uncharacterized protein LOC141707686 isoform X1 [Apium graveolens]|uniref:uncharacterized protein LOC141707686 isoform X1 n=1 Tax=Apium graveolens TaxID=4045 RepID=UPI003D7AF07C